jgi:pilus assembly protein Flp/PilA
MAKKGVRHGYIEVGILDVWRQSFSQPSADPGRGLRRASAHDNKDDKTMKNLIQKFANDESGATAIEYGLIAALIAVVIIASVQLVGTNLSTVFSNIAAAL